MRNYRDLRLNYMHEMMHELANSYAEKDIGKAQFIRDRLADLMKPDYEKKGFVAIADAIITAIEDIQEAEELIDYNFGNE